MAGLGLSVTFDVSDLVDWVDGMLEKSDAVVKASVEEGVELLVRDAKLHAPVGKSESAQGRYGGHTGGTLRRSIALVDVVRIDSGVYTGSAGPHVVYGRLREFGGTIKVKNAPYLKFVVDGQWRQATSVTQDPEPYMRPALEQVALAFRSILARNFEEAMRT